jgi:hypothetical protein
MSPKASFAYDSSEFAPPAPAAWVELRSPGSRAGSKPEKILALMDTGADGSTIPLDLITRLDLQKVGEVKVAAYDADPTNEDDFKVQPEYSVLLILAPLPPKIVRVIPSENDAYAIIGRDLLNDWLLTLDGPTGKGSLTQQ